VTQDLQQRSSDSVVKGAGPVNVYLAHESSCEPTDFLWPRVLEAANILETAEVTTVDEENQRSRGVFAQLTAKGVPD